MDIESTKKKWKRYTTLYISGKATSDHHEIMASLVPQLLDEIDKLNNKVKLLNAVIDEKGGNENGKRNS